LRLASPAPAPPEETAPPPARLSLIDAIRMTAEAVACLPDQRRQVQLQDEGGGIQRRLLPRRVVASPRSNRLPLREHALPIGA
jgi:hypothetical protein